MKLLPILLLDMDGIIADFNRHSIRVYNSIYKTHLNEDLCNTYIGDHEVLDPTINAKHLKQPYRQPGFFINIPVIKGAQEGVARLEEHFNIFVLTTHYWNNPTCVTEKEMWLTRYFPSIAENGIFTKHKHLVGGKYLVDDRPINCENWLKSNCQGTTASLQYSWSQSIHQHLLADNWEALADKIIKDNQNGNK